MSDALGGSCNAYPHQKNGGRATFGERGTEWRMRSYHAGTTGIQGASLPVGRLTLRVWSIFKQHSRDSYLPKPLGDDLDVARCAVSTLTREPICRSERTHRFVALLSRPSSGEWWSCPKSAACTTDTNDEPRERAAVPPRFEVCVRAALPCADMHRNLGSPD